MSSLRPAFLTRIGGQMAMLIIASLIGIHAVVGAGFYLTHRLESTRVLDSGPGEIITAARLVAAVPSEPERTAMIAHIAGAFPRMQFERASTMPAARAIAEAHGGTLSLHDRPSRGLSARITLPAP